VTSKERMLAKQA